MSIVVEDLSKRFSGFAALKGVSLEARPEVDTDQAQADYIRLLRAATSARIPPEAFKGDSVTAMRDGLSRSGCRIPR